MHMVGYDALCWDTQFFGFPVGVLNAIEQSPQEFRLQIANIIQSPPCRLLYVHINPEDTLTRDYVTHLGAQLVDNRVVFRKSIDIRLPAISIKDGRPAETYVDSGRNELNELALIAGRYSRFRIDSKISETDFQRLYIQWIKRSVSGAIADKVLITRDQQNSPTSLITLSCKESIGSIGLLAVRPDQQGNGLGFQLVNRALEYFSQKLCTTAEVVTQGTNTAACKLYGKCGFIPFRLSHTYHLWLPFPSNSNKR